MGKVYEALQRAEEQRRRANEGLSAGPAPLGDPLRNVAGVGAGAVRPRAWWRRLLTLSPLLARARAAVEDVGALNKRRIALLQPQSYVAEQFRSLRARLDSLAASQPLRTIAVTSANPGDGKTMTAINLALVMSLGVGRKVVLVDCDLRSPKVHESLGLRVEAGLGEVLRGGAELEEALVGVDGSALRVLPVRGLPQNPSELLASVRMREVVEKLSAEHDRVILDVPPVVGLPDAKVVSDLCDGILLVVRADSTPQAEAEAALEILDRSRVLGVVLNEVAADSGRYGHEG
jgi:capsular exopolysaccharide synthesis family protein